jgi:hypothetical protein
MVVVEEMEVIMVVPMIGVAMVMDATMVVAITEIMIEITNIAEIAIRITTRTTTTYANAYH